MCDATRPQRRTPNPRGQGDRLRAEILAATIRLLEELGGDEALSLRAVARAVGIAAPSIYRHFADKTDLVWAALGELYQQLADRMAEADAAADQGDSVARLRAQVHAYCRYAMENPGPYRLMFVLDQTTVEPLRLAQHPMRPVFHNLKEAVQRCVLSGRPPLLPAERATRLVIASAHGAVTLRRSLPITVPADVVHEVTADVLDLAFGR